MENRKLIAEAKAPDTSDIQDSKLNFFLYNLNTYPNILKLC